MPQYPLMRDGQPIGRQPGPIQITDEDKEAVLKYVLEGLHDGSLTMSNYDLYLSSSQGETGAITNFAAALYGIRDTARGLPEEVRAFAVAIAPMFRDLAWILCLQGVLRPGIRSGFSNSDPNATAYSLTGFGRVWVKQVSGEDVLALLNKLR